MSSHCSNNSNEPKIQQEYRSSQANQRVIDYAIENVEPGQFGEGPLRELYDAIIECFHDGIEVSLDQLLLRIPSPQLKSLAVFLHDEGLDKEEVLKTESELFLDRHQQMELLIGVFQSQVVESGHQLLISQLEQQKLDDKEEASELEKLLEETRQQKGISPPKEG